MVDGLIMRLDPSGTLEVHQNQTLVMKWPVEPARIALRLKAGTIEGELKATHGQFTDPQFYSQPRAYIDLHPGGRVRNSKPHSQRPTALAWRHGADSTQLGYDWHETDRIVRLILTVAQPALVSRLSSGCGFAWSGASWDNAISLQIQQVAVALEPAVTTPPLRSLPSKPAASIQASQELSENFQQRVCQLEQAFLESAPARYNIKQSKD